MHARQILLYNHNIAFLEGDDLVMIDCLRDWLFAMAILIKNDSSFHIDPCGQGEKVKLTAYFSPTASGKHFRHDIEGTRIGLALDFATYQIIYGAISSILLISKMKSEKKSVRAVVTEYLDALDIPEDCLSRDSLVRNLTHKRQKINQYHASLGLRGWIPGPSDPKI